MALNPDADSFNEPPTDDTTTTPPDPGTLNVKSASPIMNALKAVKGTKIRPPTTLASAIAKSRRARQTSHKWGT